MYAESPCIGIGVRDRTTGDEVILADDLKSMTKSDKGSRVIIRAG